MLTVKQAVRSVNVNKILDFFIHLRKNNRLGDCQVSRPCRSTCSTYNAWHLYHIDMVAIVTRCRGEEVEYLKKIQAILCNILFVR